MKKTILFKILSIFLCLILLIQISVYAIDVDSVIKSYKKAENNSEKKQILNDVESKITKENIDEYLDAYEKKYKKLKDLEASLLASGAASSPYTDDINATSSILNMIRDNAKSFSKESGKIEESDEELLKYNTSEIKEWLLVNDPSLLSDTVKKEWEKKLDSNADASTIRLLNGESVQEVYHYTPLNAPKIYKQPSKLARDDTYDDGLEQSMTDADDFITDGSNDKLDMQDFQTQFGDIYNIVLQIGVGLAVIVGIVLGVKFILSSVEGKAEVKKMLITYVISCVVIFGSFGIWKIIVTVLQTV